MPTLPSEPIKPSANEEERVQRVKSLYFTNVFLDCLQGWSYATRSHMPNNVDSTEFYEAVNKIRSFVNSRPDWNSDMLKRTFDKTFLKDTDKKEGYFNFKIL